MPRESLDAPEDLPNQVGRQMAFASLQDEGPGGRQLPADVS